MLTRFHRLAFTEFLTLAGTATALAEPLELALLFSWAQTVPASTMTATMAASESLPIFYMEVHLAQRPRS
jgi:hypothetical protein